MEKIFTNPYDLRIAKKKFEQSKVKRKNVELFS